MSRLSNVLVSMERGGKRKMSRGHSPRPGMLPTDPEWRTVMPNIARDTKEIMYGPILLKPALIFYVC